MALCAGLGITEGMSRGLPPYARILAANEKGRALLRTLDGQSAVPILTRPGAVRSLSPACRELFSLGAKAHDLYVLGLPSPAARQPGQDWRTGPFLLP